MTIKEQVELARPGSLLGVDYEFIDHSDGNGQQIRRINLSFDIPTQAELDAVLTQAEAKRDSISNATANVKAGGVGGGLPDAIRRIEDLEMALAQLL